MGEPLNFGKRALRVAFFTQSPVGVPAKTPLTLAEVTLPLRPMVMETRASPGTLKRS